MMKWKNEGKHRMASLSLHNDLKNNKERVLKMIKLRREQNLPFATIAKRFNTTGSTVKRLIDQHFEGMMNEQLHTDNSARFIKNGKAHD